MSHHFIRFTDVKYTYPGGTKALDGVSFLISHGEKVALLGLNGAGKSTLLLLSNGLLLPDSGEVDVGDVPVCKGTMKLIRQSVGLVFQNPDDQLFMPTIEDDVAFGPHNMGLPESEVERRVEAALEGVGISDLRKRPPFQLSGGQRKAASIATVLSMEPSILVLDEPTASLDMTARRRVINLLKSFRHTMLIATHDMEMALELCPRAMLMSEGIIIADGPTKEIVGDADLLTEAGMLD